MRNMLSVKLILVATILCLTISGVASAGDGEALYERWSGEGSADPMLTETSTPDYTEILTETQWGVGDDNEANNNYQGRITTWIVPPVTGNYTFWIVTDDNGRLWLSTDDNPANAQLIATETNYAGENGWGGAGDEARSDPIPLEGGKPYWLRGGYQETGGGDHIRIAWSSPEAGIADHTIIASQYLDGYSNPINASIPDPADGSVNVKVEDVQLGWLAPALLPDTTFTVYFGMDPNDKTPLISDLADPTLGVGTLATGETYYWRVDCEGPIDSNGFPTTNAGPEWTFDTAPAAPVILAQPQKTGVYPDESATYTIDVYSANSEPVTYAWSKEGSATVLSTEASLTIENAQVADEGMYYCKATNGFGTTTSDSAVLHIKLLVGHWPFDEDLEDKIGTSHGTALGDPLPIIDTEEKINGGGSVKFSIGGAAAQAVRIPSTGVPAQSSLTISFWEKTDADATANSYMLASGDAATDGSTIGYEWLYVWRRAGDVHYMGFYLGRNFVIHGAINGGMSGIPREEWHLCTLVYDYDLNIYYYYVDGIQLDSYQMVQRMEAFVDDFFVANRENMTRPYMGNIDDLRIHNFAMTDIEVAKLYTDTAGGYVCLEPVQYDANNDCILDVLDLAIFAAEWLDCNKIPVEACD